MFESSDMAVPVMVAVVGTKGVTNPFVVMGCCVCAAAFETLQKAAKENTKNIANLLIADNLTADFI